MVDQNFGEMGFIVVGDDSRPKFRENVIDLGAVSAEPRLSEDKMWWGVCWCYRKLVVFKVSFPNTSGKKDRMGD